jgi:hypothetical protein
MTVSIENIVPEKKRGFLMRIRSNPSLLHYGRGVSPKISQFCVYLSELSSLTPLTKDWTNACYFFGWVPEGADLTLNNGPQVHTGPITEADALKWLKSKKRELTSEDLSYINLHSTGRIQSYARGQLFLAHLLRLVGMGGAKENSFPHPPGEGGHPIYPRSSTGTSNQNSRPNPAQSSEADSPQSSEADSSQQDCSSLELEADAILDPFVEAVWATFLETPRLKLNMDSSHAGVKYTTESYRTITRIWLFNRLLGKLLAKSNPVPEIASKGASPEGLIPPVQQEP